MRPALETKPARERESQIALFVDSENQPVGALSECIKQLELRGRLVLKRAYADWTSTSHKKKAAECKQHEVRMEVWWGNKVSLPNSLSILF